MKASSELWQPDAMAALLAAQHADPFGCLGMHALPGSGGLVVRVLLPGAVAVSVIDHASGAVVTELERLNSAGCFAGVVKRRRKPFRYRLRVDRGDGAREQEDPYCFPSVVSPHDLYLFAEGTHERAWHWMGAHCRSVDGVEGVLFVVWAPGARRVSVVGDFNGWDGRVHPMRVHPANGVWELFLPGLASGLYYKYEILAGDGRVLPLKTDPYAFLLQSPGANASIVSETRPYDWRDQAWMRGRGARHHREAPLSIYEVHLGSWRRAAGNAYLGYRELAEQLVSYVSELGFTHVELLPSSEYPFDGSWGYQPLGMFAPTSRFGVPDDFRYLVDRFHQAGIGVLLDWVPAHFPADAHGLSRFDGTCLYEHEDPRKGFHRDWNTLIYNYGRNEVVSYLISNAHFWMEEFHLDGLRVDAVASMLYLDYSRKPGEWIPNAHGGNENLEAIAFLRRLNERLYLNYPDSLTMAEESTAWPGVSRPTSDGGLGFGFKWNMGWMHDTLHYMALDPVHRRFHHDKLTFGLLYAFSENFILPLSHDEVVHGKGSLIARMPGDEWQRHATLRAYYGFMWMHPGKKLLFMGGEIAQEREWCHDGELDWQLLQRPLHAGLQRLVRDLNALYRDAPALYTLDCEAAGFEWIEFADAKHSVFAWLRRGREPGSVVLVVSNFTPVPRRAFRLGVDAPGFWRERINTDSALYGGSNVGNAGGLHSEAVRWHGRAHSLRVSLPPLATVVFEYSAN